MTSLETSGFWTPLLLCVAVSTIFALLVLYYFRQQINTLDHKINSMFSLITSITNELNRLTMLQNNVSFNETNIDNNLNQIIVSDDEDNHEDESEGDESEGDESEGDESRRR